MPHTPIFPNAVQSTIYNIYNNPNPKTLFRQFLALGKRGCMRYHMKPFKPVCLKRVLGLGLLYISYIVDSIWKNRVYEVSIYTTPFKPNCRKKGFKG